MTLPDPKIIDLINAKKDGDDPFTSLEFFPPRSEEGVIVRSIKKIQTSLEDMMREIHSCKHSHTPSLTHILSP